MTSFIWHSGEGKNRGKEIRLVVAQGLGAEGRELFGGDANVLCLDCDGGYMTVHIVQSY